MITWTSTRVLGLAGLLALGTSFAAFAQDQDTSTEAPVEAPSEETTEQAEQAVPSVEDELSLGEDANAAAQANGPYTADKIDDWELRCIRSDQENDPCQMYQLLSDSAGTPIAEFSLFRLPAGGRAEAGATVVVPLETALQQQLTIAVDNGSSRRYPYSYCTQVGCFARIGLTPEDVTSFKRGNSAKMTIVPVLAPDQKVEVTLSLKGFTAAYNKVSVIQQ